MIAARHKSLESCLRGPALLKTGNQTSRPCIHRSFGRIAPTKIVANCTDWTLLLVRATFFKLNRHVLCYCKLLNGVKAWDKRFKLETVLLNVENSIILVLLALWDPKAHFCYNFLHWRDSSVVVTFVKRKQKENTIGPSKNLKSFLANLLDMYRQSNRGSRNIQ